jgi:hypothetical protein
VKVANAGDAGILAAEVREARGEMALVRKAVAREGLAVGEARVDPEASAVHRVGRVDRAEKGAEVVGTAVVVRAGDVATAAVPVVRERIVRRSNCPNWK